MEQKQRKNKNSSLTASQIKKLESLAKMVDKLPVERKKALMVDLNKLVFTTNEVASLLGLHPETVRRAIWDKKLKAVKMGKTYRITRSAINKYWRLNGGENDLF